VLEEVEEVEGEQAGFCESAEDEKVRVGQGRRKGIVETAWSRCPKGMGGGTIPSRATRTGREWVSTSRGAQGDRKRMEAS
jgi:hypothetical protein